MKEHDLTTHMLEVDSLHPHPDNPNNGDVDAIRNSIRVSGFLEPILVQSSTRRILAGEHRWIACQLEGLTHIPGHLLDVDDREAKRILVSHNAVARRGSVDNALLAPLLQEFIATDEGLMGTGYDPEDVMEILTELEEPLGWRDFGVPAADPPDYTPQLIAEAGFNLIPQRDEDGRCTEVTFTATDFSAITPRMLNMLRHALGQRQLRQDEFAQYDIPAWKDER